MLGVEEHLAPLGYMYPLPLVHPSGMTVLFTGPLDRPITVLRRQSALALLPCASIGLRCRCRWRSYLLELERLDVWLAPKLSILCRVLGRAGSPKRVAFRSALLLFPCLRVHTKDFSEVCSEAGQQPSPLSVTT